jgi:hypothetical protein
MPIRDKAGSGKRLKRKESGRRVRGSGYRWVWDGKVPQVRVVCLAPSEEGQSRSRRVKKGARQVSEDSVPGRADEGGDTEERVGQVRRGKKVT